MTDAPEIEQLTILKYIKDNWDEDAYGPLVYPNLDNPAARVPGVTYSSVQIVPNEGGRIRNSIGAPKMITNMGFVFFTVYTPEGKGTLEQTRILGFIQNLFDEKSLPLDGLTDKFMRFDVSSPETLGLKDGTYRKCRYCPYHWDEN